MKYALVTPSYEPDFEQCRLLCETIDQYVEGDYHHYLIVEAHDRALFSSLRSPRRSLHIVESVLPRWLRRLPAAKRWWFSLKTPPVRNWIAQQIVKLSTAEFLDEDAFVFFDSDVALIRKLVLSDFERDGKLRLFRVPNEGRLPKHLLWQKSAGALLGLPKIPYYGATYIGHPVTWRRDVLLKLHHQIEAVSGRHWVEEICRHWQISEYIIYGLFADHCLGQESGHFHEEVHLSHNSWDYALIDDKDVQKFCATIRPEHLAVMVSAKQHIGVDRYRSLLFNARNSGNCVEAPLQQPTQLLAVGG
jgi:hypothetical protein